MRGNKFEKSHIHILKPETLSRESKVTESAQEIVDSTPCNSLVIANYRPMSTKCQHLYTFGEEVYCTRIWEFTWWLSDCEELSGGYLEVL